METYQPNVVLEGLITLSRFMWENLTDLFIICMSTAIMKWLRKYVDYIGKFKKAGLIWMDGWMSGWTEKRWKKRKGEENLFFFKNTKALFHYCSKI